MPTGANETSQSAFRLGAGRKLEGRTWLTIASRRWGTTPRMETPVLASPLRRQMLHPTLLSLAWHAEGIGASCVSACKDGHSCGTSLGFDHAFVYGCAQGGVGRRPLSARAFRFSEDQPLRGQLETLQQAGRDSHCWPLLNWRRRPCISSECCEGLGVLCRLDGRGGRLSSCWQGRVPPLCAGNPGVSRLADS